MSELDDLASLLYPKTLEEKIQWILDSDQRIHTVQARNIIEIVYNGEDKIGLKVRNKDGIILTEEEFDFYTESFDKLVGIFNKVRRAFLKVDETLNEITSRLRAL